MNHDANVLVGIRVRNATLTAINRVGPGIVQGSSIPVKDLYSLLHMLSQTPKLWETRTAAVIGVICKAMRRGFSVAHSVSDKQLWTIKEVHWLVTELGAALTAEESDRLASQLTNLYALPVAPPPELGALGTMIFRLCEWHIEHTGKEAERGIKARTVRQLNLRARACDEATTLEEQKRAIRHMLDAIEDLLRTLDQRGIERVMSDIYKTMTGILDTPDLWKPHGRM